MFSFAEDFFAKRQQMFSFAEDFFAKRQISWKLIIENYR
jgi:hypothetical protein